MSAKIDEEAHTDLVSIAFISSLQNMSNVTLTFDLKINRVHPLTIASMSAEFNEAAHNG